MSTYGWCAISARWGAVSSVIAASAVGAPNACPGGSAGLRHSLTRESISLICCGSPLMLGVTMISIGNLLARLVRTGARLVAVLVAAVLLGAALYVLIGAWRDRHVLKQIGRSVDIGGRTLNIHCTGEGSPTVVFVSARTAPGYVWTSATSPEPSHSQGDARAD